MHEDEGGVIPQGTPIPKVATCCTDSEFAKWSTRSQDARTSCDHQSASQSSWCHNVDYRIPGIYPFNSPTTGHESQRTSQKVDSAVRESPEQGFFFLQDLNKTEEINTFSEKSKKLITDMGNTEIFELFETSSKKQCPDCAFFGELALCTAHVEEV